MPWIDLPGDEATPDLARATRSWRQRGVAVPSVVAVMKLFGAQALARHVAWADGAEPTD